MNDFPIPESTKEAVAWWDDNRPVMSLSMSGIGPANEQCIQIAVMEILRNYLDKKLPTEPKDAKQEIKSLVPEIVKTKVITLSDQEIQGAVDLAFQYLFIGYKETIKLYSESMRQIMVSRQFPAKG